MEREVTVLVKFSVLNVHLVQSRGMSLTVTKNINVYVCIILGLSLIFTTY